MMIKFRAPMLTDVLSVEVQVDGFGSDQLANVTMVADWVVI